MVYENNMKMEMCYIFIDPGLQDTENYKIKINIYVVSCF